MGKYVSKKDLYRLYIKENKTKIQVAKELGVSFPTIKERLEYFNIEKEKDPKLYYAGKKIQWYPKVSYPLIQTKKGKRIMIHRNVMANKLGRKLTSDEHIHHIDLDKNNFNINNLCLTDIKEHAKIKTQLMVLVSELIKKGIIYFNREEKKYFSKF